MLEILFFSVSIPDLKDEASELIDGITTHFTFLRLTTSVIEKVKKERQFSINENEGKAYINENVFFNSLNYALSFGIKMLDKRGLIVFKNL